MGTRKWWLKGKKIQIDSFMLVKPCICWQTNFNEEEILILYIEISWGEFIFKKMCFMGYLMRLCWCRLYDKTRETEEFKRNIEKKFAKMA